MRLGSAPASGAVAGTPASHSDTMGLSRHLAALGELHPPGGGTGWKRPGRAGSPNAFAWGSAFIILLLLGTVAAWQWYDSFPKELQPGVWKNALTRAGFFVLICGAMAGLVALREQLRILAGCLMLVALWADLATHVPNQNPAAPASIYAPGWARRQVQWDCPPKIGESRVMLAAAAEEALRLYSLPNLKKDCEAKRRAFFANSNLLDEVPQTYGFFSLAPAEAADLLNLPYVQTNRDLPALMDFLGVSHMTAPGTLFDWQPRPTAMPLVTAGQKPVFAQDNLILDAITTGSHVDLRRIVFLPEEARKECSITQRVSAQVLDPEFANQRISLGTEAPAASLVVIAQSFYPAWKAYVDGQRTKLYRANYGFQALTVPAGRHHVELRYEDWAFMTGAGLSVVGLAGCLGLWLMAHRAANPQPNSRSVWGAGAWSRFLYSLTLLKRQQAGAIQTLRDLDHPASLARQADPAEWSSFPTQWLGLAVVGVVFALVAVLTWRKWPDVLIDFGMQLYLPWKISSGSVLYRDVMYLTGGPLSQHWNALLFTLFGTSLLTLVVFNLALTATLLLILYRKFLAASDVLTATTICLAVVLVFAFGHYGNVGNFNFITPYSHEALHGLVLSITGVVLLSSWVERKKLGFALGAGFCAGLVFLTKPEMFAALTVSGAGACILTLGKETNTRFVLPSLAGFLSAGMLPLVAFLLFFHQFEDWQHSWHSVIFAWLPLFESSVSKGFYYRWCLGLDTPWYHLGSMLLEFFVLAGIVTICALLFREKLKNRLVPVLAIAGLLALASRFGWVNCGRSLPLVMLSLCLILCARYRQLSVRRPLAFPLLWSFFSLALLAKLGLFSRIWHYGFVLAMPAFAGAIYLLLWTLPMLLESHGVQRRLFRLAFWLPLILGFGFLFAQSQVVYAYKTVRVGSKSDTILALEPQCNPVGTAMNSALNWMKTNMSPNATLAVLPEGIIVNYLSRRTNPTGYFVWNPAELEAFGQPEMVAAFQKHSPDYIMFIHRDNSEFGAGYFGQKEDFGLELMQWIQQNYEPVYLIGTEPFQSKLFGLQIVKKALSTGHTLSLLDTARGICPAETNKDQPSRPNGRESLEIQ